MAGKGNIKNLRPPWKPGESGNLAGRPKTKPLTDELQRLLGEEAPKGKGQTWAALIAEALVKRASKGDVRAIAELGNRIEGRPVQAVELDADVNAEIVERLEAARRRTLEMMTDEQLDNEIKKLEAKFGYLRSRENQDSSKAQQ
jgi:hypothetical protein